MKIDFIHLETVGSTNTWAKEQQGQFKSDHITCITAREQTAGRGRQGKRWISCKDTSLSMTLFFTVSAHAPYLSNLGQIMALACAELLHSLHVPSQLKWPNDILVHAKKIGGVLTETFSLPHSDRVGVALGLGLNVHVPENILKTLQQPATSLHLLLDKNLEPSSLVQPLLELLTAYLTTLQKKGFAPFHERFNQLLAYKGKTLTLHLPQKVIQGMCESITAEGLLNLRLPSGDCWAVSAGEIL